jgi:hypothetical protein
LLYHAGNLHTDPTPTPVTEEAIPQWQQTPWGKILVGVILVQGLSFGMQQLLTAGFLASGDGTDVWQTLLGLVLHHAVHAISLLVGGALVGAGQRRGILYGALVGFASGALTLLWQERGGENFSSALFYAEPVIHLAIGAMGGALGMLIWRPTPILPELDGNTPVPTLSTGASLG